MLTHLRNSEAPHEEPDGANSVFEERAIGPTYCIAPKPQICRATIRSGSCPTRSTCVLGFATQESRTMPPFTTCDVLRIPVEDNRPESFVAS